MNPITAVVGTTEGESTNSGYTVVGDENTYYYDLKMEITNNKLFDMPAAGGGFRATIFGVVIMIIAGGWYGIRKRKRININLYIIFDFNIMGLHLPHIYKEPGHF